VTRRPSPQPRSDLVGLHVGRLGKERYRVRG
jgi:hypothetical protein